MGPVERHAPADSNSHSKDLAVGIATITILRQRLDFSAYVLRVALGGRRRSKHNLQLRFQ